MNVFLYLDYDYICEESNAKNLTGERLKLTEEQVGTFYLKKLPEGKRRSYGKIEIEDDPNYTPQPTESELLTTALNEKHAEIDKAMSENVCTEFHDDALGQTHSYDCREVDQANITQAIRIAEQIGYADYLAKPTGKFFQMIQHSLDQLKKVDLAMHAHISHNRSIARAKKSEAVTAHENGDIEAIKAVSVTPWE